MTLKTPIDVFKNSIPVISFYISSLKNYLSTKLVIYISNMNNYFSTSTSEFVNLNYIPLSTSCYSIAFYLLFLIRVYNTNFLSEEQFFFNAKTLDSVQ